MNTIILFRGRRAASKFPAAPTQPAKSASSRVDCTCVIQRPALVAVWHASPFNGRLECLWTAEAHATIADEDDSPCASLQRAA